MKFNLIVLLVALLFQSCTEQKKSVSENVKQEIDNRFTILKQISRYNDSLSVALSLFKEKTDRLLLLSKDVENPGAAVIEGNSYFEGLFKDLSLQQQGRVMLTLRMDADEVELHIRENELQVLNELVFLNSGVTPFLSSVKETEDE